MDLETINISDLTDIEAALRMRDTNYEKFKSLVRMHLSFELDLNTDEFDFPCHEIIYEEKGKLKKWNRFSKKNKTTGGSSGCAVYTKGASSISNSPSEGVQQQIDPGFFFHLKELKEFLMQENNITQEGLFRKTGSISRQNELRSQIQEEKQLDLVRGGYSAHDCATVFKGYLAELPEPLLTDAHYPAHLQIAPLCMSTSLQVAPAGKVASLSSFRASYALRKTQNPERIKREEHLLNSIQLLLLLLPSENRQLLEQIIEMLHAVASRADLNKMTADNLATIFTPHLICPRNLPPEALHHVAKKMCTVISYLIQKGAEVFEVPARLSTDIRAYFLERKRKKTMSPECTLDESISDVSTVNTVYTFVDREKTAAAHTTNNTDTELAQLYAHIQSLPESSKKRRLIKQFNKQNGQGTPLQLVVMDRLKNSEATRSAKSIGDSIKKHIFHKSIISRTPKQAPGSSYNHATPNFSTSKNLKMRALFQSPATTSACAINSPSSIHSVTPIALSKVSNRNRLPSRHLTVKVPSMSSPPQQSSTATTNTNLSSFGPKTHPLQKSISSSSLLSRSAYYQVDKEGIDTGSTSSTSSSSSSSGSTSSASSICSSSSDDFSLQSTLKLSASAPVSRQASSDLNAVAVNMSCTSLYNTTVLSLAKNYPDIENIKSLRTTKIEEGNNYLENKSVAWNEYQMANTTTSTTEQKLEGISSDLKCYQSEPDLSYLFDDKSLNQVFEEHLDNQSLQITPICKGKSLTRKLMKGVSMGNLKLPFSTPETTKRLGRNLCMGNKQITNKESPTILNKKFVLKSPGSCYEGDLNDAKPFEIKSSENILNDHVEENENDKKNDEVDTANIIAFGTASARNACTRLCEEDSPLVSIGEGGGSSSSSELPGANSYKNLLHNSNIYRNLDLVTSTPSLMLGRRSMSPITKSTQRMPKSMQESIMTPRSRKPVMMITTSSLASGSSSDQNLTTCQPDLSNFREQDEENSLSGSAVVNNFQYNSIPGQILNIDEDALDGYSAMAFPLNQNASSSHDDTINAPSPAKMSEASHSPTQTLSNNFNVIAASPEGSSTSSQPDDFGAPHDIEDLNVSLSPSLMHCLNGNQPSDDEAKLENVPISSDTDLNPKNCTKAINSVRINRLSNNPFIILNNARKRAATGDLEKSPQQRNNDDFAHRSGCTSNSSKVTPATTLSSLTMTLPSSSTTNNLTSNDVKASIQENPGQSQVATETLQSDIMGGWTLEVGKMALYMAFPVSLFYIFNQPQYFEEWVTKTKREIYPPDNLTHKAEIEKAIKDIREKQNAKIIMALEENDKINKVE